MNRAFPFLLALLPLAACQHLAEELAGPGKEQPVAAKDSYLQTGGVRTELDLGKNHTLLLQDFTEARAAKVQLEARVKELETEIESVRASLRRAEEERDRERLTRSGAEAIVERQQRLLHERDSKILSLGIERARLQQEVLRLKIAALQTQIDAFGKAAVDPAAAPVGGEK
jgi:chromosome segregation ATPase